jgi:hypothetical protein
MIDGKLILEISDPDSVVAEDASLLACDDVSLGENFPTFRRSQCLYLHGQAILKSGITRPKTKCRISEDTHL